jgi:hypothetical protein
MLIGHAQSDRLLQINPTSDIAHTTKETIYFLTNSAFFLKIYLTDGVTNYLRRNYVYCTTKKLSLKCIT